MTISTPAATAPFTIAPVASRTGVSRSDEYNSFYRGAGPVDFRGISVGAATLIVSHS